MSLRLLTILAVLILAATPAAPAIARSANPAGEARITEQAASEPVEARVFTRPAIYADSAYLQTNSMQIIQTPGILNSPAYAPGPTVVLPPTCVKVVLPARPEKAKAKKKSRGILAKIFGGILDPLTSGLDDVGSNLENTAFE